MIVQGVLLVVLPQIPPRGPPMSSHNPLVGPPMIPPVVLS